MEIFRELWEKTIHHSWKSWLYMESIEFFSAIWYVFCRHSGSSGIKKQQNNFENDFAGTPAHQ